MCKTRSVAIERVNRKDVALMNEEKDGKKLAFWLVLFFLLIIFLGGFVGKRLVQIVRASRSQEASIETPVLPGKNGEEKDSFASETLDSVTPLGIKGGYSFPTPTPTQLPTKTNTPSPMITETTVPTEAETTVPTITETIVPTETETTVPTITETIVPTEAETTVPTKTETSVPTETPTRTVIIFVEGTETPTSTATEFPTSTATEFPTSTATETPTNSVTESATSTATASPTSTVTKAPSQPPTVGPGGDPGNYVGAGMVFGLVALVCFCLYFWNLVQVRRER